MQTIYTYSYNPAISTGTNATGTIWRMGYQQPIELYKGINNQIKIVAFNPAKKVLDLTGYNIEVQIVDTHTKTYYITKTAVIDTPTNGVATVTFTDSDLSILDARFYDVIARLVDKPDYSTIVNTEMLYINDNFGAFTPVKVVDAWNFTPGGGAVNNGALQSNQIVPVPTSSIGSGGDMAGMIATDGDYIYYCVANFDGSTVIWKRTAIEAW